MPSLPARDRVADFFGLRLEMVVLILGVGLGGGAIGAAYLEVLKLIGRLLGPERWSGAPQIAVLATTGVAVTLLIRVLGKTADVELLVGNIHVEGTTGDAGHHASDDSGDHGKDDGRLRSLIPVSLLCIGAGGTLGPEAPLVTATGTLATRAGRRAGVGSSDRRILAITGMAAGFAVLFGAPLGAAIFALEIPHRRGLEYYEAIVPAVIGALCGYAVSTTFGGLGLEPIWQFPDLMSFDGVDLFWAVIAGVLGAAIGIAFTLCVDVLQAILRRLPSDARPAIGGITLGLLALASPYALTNGEFQIVDFRAGMPIASTLLIAGAVKLVAAAISLVSGWRGGFIIPLFFTGYVFGVVVAGWLSIEHDWVFVAATMVAANVAVTKTPLGSTLVITEMTGLTLGPVMIVSALVSLVLTSPIGLIENQRRRFDAFQPVPSSDPHPANPDSTAQASTGGGSTDHGSTDHGSTDRGSPALGSTDPGSTDHRSTDRGSPALGSTDPGSPDRGTSPSSTPASSPSPASPRTPDSTP